MKCTWLRKLFTQQEYRKAQTGGIVRSMFCEILVAVNNKFTVFMDVISCWLVDMLQLFLYHKESDNKFL
jgi:hypothetical protein